MARLALVVLLGACGTSSSSQTSVDAGRDAAADAGGPDARVAVSFVYVGSSSGSIFVYKLDPATGTLGAQGSTVAGGNPSFLAVDPTHRFLYAADEGQSRVVALSIDARTGALAVLNRTSSSGSGPAHLSVDATGRWVLAANYGGGTVAVIPIGADGRVAPAVDTHTPGVNPHQILTDAQNRWALVPCRGSDWIMQYAFDPVQGKLADNPVAHATTAANAGPRHLAFDPTGRHAYVIDENDSTVTAYRFDATTGRLSALQTLSTLPAGVTVPNTGAEIAVHPSGKFLYASNRGHDSIVAYAIDPATGRLTLLGHTATGGQTPRSFTLDAAGTLLYAANQKSGTVTAFRVDPAAGSLTPLGPVATVTGPEFVGIVSQ